MLAMTKLPFYRPLTAFLLLTFCASVGCSTVRTVPVSPETEKREAIASLNDAVAGKRPRVALASSVNVTPDEAATWKYVGSKWTTVAAELKVLPDSVSWLGSSADESYQMSWFEIENITLVSRRRGALEGLAVGLALGAVLVAAVSISTAGREKSGWEGVSEAVEEADAIEHSIYIGAVLGGVGLAIGFGRGHRYVYKFEQPSQRKDRMP
jgi:hypothetical protein